VAAAELLEGGPGEGFVLLPEEADVLQQVLVGLAGEIGVRVGGRYLRDRTLLQGGPRG
jgi:hypothetical protein